MGLPVSNRPGRCPRHAVGRELPAHRGHEHPVARDRRRGGDLAALAACPAQRPGVAVEGVDAARVGAHDHEVVAHRGRELEQRAAGETPARRPLGGSHPHGGHVARPLGSAAVLGLWRARVVELDDHRVAASPGPTGRQARTARLDVARVPGQLGPPRPRRPRRRAIGRARPRSAMHPGARRRPRPCPRRAPRRRPASRAGGRRRRPASWPRRRHPRIRPPRPREAPPRGRRWAYSRPARPAGLPRHTKITITPTRKPDDRGEQHACAAGWAALLEELGLSESETIYGLLVWPRPSPG